METGDSTLVRAGAVAETPGASLGGWQLERELGRGGMGSVWLARHLILGHRAALKILHPELSRVAEHAQRFIEEARTGATLRHPGLVQVFDLFLLPDSRPCFVMEYLDGITLEQVAGTTPMPPSRVRELLLPLAGAVGEMHFRGLVHRDVKAQNVMLLQGREGEETLKLLDLGIAKNARAQASLTLPGTAMGTPHYMSPEQALGAPVDFRADVYSLGVLAYRLLSGKLPFEGSVPEVMLQHVQAEPPPLVQGSEAFRALVRRAMQKKPADRFDTAGEFARALRQVIPETPPVVAAAPIVAPAPAPRVSSPPPPVAPLSGASRRPRAERFRRRFAVSFGPAESAGQAGFTTNVSASGIAVTTQHPLPAGSRVFLRFTHAENGPRLQGFVAWSKSPALRGGNGAMGVRIDGADESYFRLLLEVAKGGEPRELTPLLRARPQVMVVEDNRDVRMLLADAFTQEGYEVLPCADGGLALAAMERLRSPSAVVLDLMMPLVNGWKFLDALRASPEHRDVPVIVLSAHPEAHRLPGTHFVPKPFELDAVTGLVGRLMTRAA